MFGSASFAESEWSPEVARLSTELIGKLGFAGVCGTEYKPDPRDGRWKLIEVNPRPTLWFSLTRAAGCDVVFEAYRDLVGRPGPRSERSATACAAPFLRDRRASPTTCAGASSRRASFARRSCRPQGRTWRAGATCAPPTPPLWPAPVARARERRGRRAVSWLAFTVDVEEWFHVLDVASAPAPAEWDRLPMRVERNTRVLLDHLDASGVRATFFVLGWVAERQPELVREIVRRGHELACHGHEHVLAFRVGRAAFRDDARRRKRSRRLGEGVVGYRAAGFSITEHPWPSTSWPRPASATTSLRRAGARGSGPSVRTASSRRAGAAGGVPDPRFLSGPLRVPFSSRATASSFRRSCWRTRAPRQSR
jgi:peptidoglycan/xylan/chitin deacetylase (PgdA/CDA1 family)